MLQQLFSFLEVVEDGLWSYIASPMLLLVGLYLTVSSNFFQIRQLPASIRRFIQLLRTREQGERGVHPLKAFFASIGGCVGIGNIAGICTAVQIGGPGALFWIWVTAIAGTVVKYAEIYLGLRYRVANDTGGYNGGPMYFLQHAFKGSWAAIAICILLCVYGVEVYQFSVITDSIVNNWDVNLYLVIGVLLTFVLFASAGGIRRVGNIASLAIPVFVVLYIGMGLWVLLNNIHAIPSAIGSVFGSAFTGTAAMGGFAGSTLMLAMSHGVRRGCYVGDLGVGYASVIHSESSVKVPEEQASLTIFELFLDVFVICTTSVLLVLVTDTWRSSVDSSMMVQNALGQYFPYMHFFMPFFLFLLGYSTINAYFCVGLKCAEFLSPKRGKVVFYIYGVTAFILFSFVGNAQAQTVMTIANGLLLLLNCAGIFRLRHQISFAVPSTKEKTPSIATAAAVNEH